MRRCFKEIFKGKADGDEIANDNVPQEEYECEKLCVLNKKCTFFQFMEGPVTGNLNKCKLFEGEKITKKADVQKFTTYKLLNQCCRKKIFEGLSYATQLERYTDKSFYSIEECKAKCEANLDCQEFRVLKNPNVDTNKAACVLCRAGAKPRGDGSGALKLDHYKLKAC